MKTRLLWTGCSFVLLLGLFHACQRVSERGRFAAPYSTYGAGPLGSFALYRLTRDLGFSPDRLSHEIARLPPHATLIAVGGCDEPSSRDLKRPEREALNTWIERGGLLIVLGAGDYVPENVGLKLTGNATCKAEVDNAKANTKPPSEDGPLPFTIDAIPKGAPLTYGPTVSFEGARRVSTSDEEQATVLFDSERGPLAMTVPHGRGRVVLFGSSSPFTNAQLEYGGAAVIARLLRAFARPNTVLFDEYHLGMGERRSVVGYLRERGYALLLIQAVLVAVCFLYVSGMRLGPPRARERAIPRGTQRFLSALAAMFARTKDDQGALAILSHHGLLRIRARYRALAVPLDELERWLHEQGYQAAATFAARVREHGQTPLLPNETLSARASQLERDVNAAVVIGVD